MNSLIYQATKLLTYDLLIGEWVAFGIGKNNIYPYNTIILLIT